MFISELYGKKICGDKKAKRGVIYAVTYTSDVICGFACFDGAEKEFFVSAEGTKTGGNEAFYKTRIKEPKDAKRLRLGIPVFSDTGKYLGKLTDCTYKNSRLTYAVCGRKKYPFASLAISDAAILKNPEQCAENAAKNMFIATVCEHTRGEITART